MKLIGVEGGEHSVESALARARPRDGRRDEPSCSCAPFTIDEDNWTDGFMGIPTARTTNPSAQWSHSCPHGNLIVVELPR